MIVVADDPGMHSSQNEQDTRHYARFAKVPMLEPSDSQEAKDFVTLALEISEQYRTPVILRSATRVSHSRSLVELSRAEAVGQADRFREGPAAIRAHSAVGPADAGAGGGAARQS